MLTEKSPRCGRLFCLYLMPHQPCSRAATGSGRLIPYTSSMPQPARSEILLYILTALLCVLARQHLLLQTGLTDYDSVRNWQIIQQVGQGNFRHLFHHASPGFFLFFGLLALFCKGVYPFIWLNMAFNVAAVLLVLRFCRRHLRLPLPEAFLVGSLFGLSVFTVSTGRNLATESVSMLLFMLMLESYLRRLQQASPKALLQAAGWLALGLTVNYKLLLVLPVALVLELWQRDGVLTRRLLLQAGLILLAPFGLFAGIALAVGQPFYQLPATIVSINHFTRPTPAQRTGRLNADLLFYVRYLLDFEWALLVAGIGLFPVCFRQELFGTLSRRLSPLQGIFLVTYLILLGMHLLVKAPRGLMLIYGPLYGLTGLVLLRALRYRWLVLALLGLGIAGQTGRLQRHIYAYTPTHYPQVAAYLRQQGIEKVATTVGLNLLPYARQQGITVQVILREADLAALRAQGFTHVLLDDYYRAAHVQQFDGLRQLRPQQAWPEPPLTSPLLYLDHAEFNGLSYGQVLENQRQARRDSLQLRLIRIP